jgi:hypothetical protein
VVSVPLCVTAVTFTTDSNGIVFLMLPSLALMTVTAELMQDCVSLGMDVHGGVLLELTA